MIKVSVLVPIYNVEKYLEQCLDSIINQTLKEIEIICLNDGSTDKSLEILEKYAVQDNRINIINKENSGYGATLNIGLKQAKGEYISIIESDDFIDLNMLKEMYEKAKIDDLDILKADWFLYFEADNQTYMANKIPLIDEVTNAKKHKELFLIPPSVWSSIFKKAFLDKHNIRFLETPGASFQDTSFSFKTTALATKVKTINKAFYYYRQDNSNSSIHNKNKVFCICDEYDEIFRFLESNNELKREFINYYYILKYQGYFWNILRLDEECMKEFADRFYKDFSNEEALKYLDDLFFKLNNRKYIDALLKDKQDFLKLIKKRQQKDEKRKQKRKLIAVKLRKSLIEVRIFGKSLINLRW